MGGNASGLLIVVVALIILWLGVTGKFDCFTGTFNCMLKGPDGAAADAGGVAAQAGALGTGALDRVTAKLGPSYSFPLLANARTPDFA